MELLELKKTHKIIKKNFECKICNFTCTALRDWTIHIARPKHQRKFFGEQKNSLFCEHICEKCNKIFKTSSGLWKHSNSNKCSTNFKSNNSYDDKELIINLLQQNKDLHQSLIDMSKDKTIINNANINCNNKTFNMNFFLNETCKDAMNITEFVTMIQPKIEELEETGRLGYVTGISNIILNQLKTIEQNDRPMHCRDLKREVLYVKDKDEWNKETDDKPILTNAIKMVAHKNMKNINKWRTDHPDCSQYNSRSNNKYLNIVSNSMAGIDEEDINKNMTKIVSNIVKEVSIDK